MRAISILIIAALATIAHGQEWYVDANGAWVPMQCCPQGGCCPGGNCYPQQRPRFQPQPQPQPDYQDEQQGPLPNYEVRPTAPLTPVQPLNPPITPGNPATPPLPAPVQPAAPTQPPAPTIDQNALKDQTKQLTEHFEKIEKSLLVIQSTGGCQCDNAKIEAAMRTLSKQQEALLVAIANNRPQVTVQPANPIVQPPAPIQTPAQPPVAGPVLDYYDLVPHKEN
jgi:hypothetical protein